MNVFRLLAVSFMLAAVIPGFQKALAEEDAPIPIGAIRFVHDTETETKLCGLALNSGNYHFRGRGSVCSNDDLNYFRLDNAPSALEFTIMSDVRIVSYDPVSTWDCDERGSVANGWIFKLKTYIHPVSTGWISIASLIGLQEGDIVKAGVRLISKKHAGGDGIDEASCFQVRRSALP